MKANNCYLCVYRLPDTPEAIDPLPAGGLNETVGTCYKCSVWACALHGTLYEVFECAKCTPGIAVQDAITEVPVVGAEAVTAGTYYRSEWPSFDELHYEVLRIALRAIEESQYGMAERPSLPIDPYESEPNLITNLAGVIDRLMQDEDGPRFVTDIEIAAVGAAVRKMFAYSRIRSEQITGSAVAGIVAGALQMAYVLADEEFAARRANGLVAYWKPPWRVTRPQLLHPVIWLVATAFYMNLPEHQR